MMLLLFLFSLLCVDSTAFSRFHAPKLSQSGAAPTSCTLLFASDKKKKNLFQDNGDNLFSNNDKDEDPKLGIDIGKMLEPLTPEQAQELRAEASEMIADKVAKGIDDIQDLRKQLTREVEKERNQRLMKSERDAAQASKRLLQKIDSLTSDFMSTSESMRKSTKLAAAADRANEGKGVELGSWGSLGGVSVATGGGGLLGSVASSEATTTRSSTTTLSTMSDNEESVETAPKENRIIMIADPSQDPMAKTLVPAFCDLIQSSMDVTVEVLKPTMTMPLSGNNAQCVILFATSLNDAVGCKNMLDRLLRRTLLGNGKMGNPPTQLVCVSTLGTERTNKMPYSLQNVLGGKLDKRRQVEEAVVNTVQQRVTEPPLDYTILKLGQIKENANESFELEAGDTLDGSISPQLAANVLQQAVAFQPFARNATFGIVGNMPADSSQYVWDEAFVKLDGPELLRITDNLGDASYLDQLHEYLGEWALMMESGKKKLATPIRVAPSSIQPANLAREGVKERAGVRLLFLPTNTGSAYMSKAEERAREEQSGTKSSSTSSRKRRTKPEGGVEVLVEVTKDDTLRVRAKRCNMADDTVLKEISEETILKRLKESLDVWSKDIIV